MKKVIALALVVLLVLGTCYASQAQRTVTINYNDIRIKLNGDYLVPQDTGGNVVEPFTIDGTTYLPVRAVATAFGLDVSWDAATKTVILDSHPVYITRTGKRYHYDNHCNGGTYFPATLDVAKNLELTPCDKCVLKER